MGDTKKHYEIADKAWQVVVGCSPSMPCAPRCWARRTVARIVECQRGTSPERAEFYGIALTPDGQKWSGEVRLDREHLLDPLKWRKSAVVATGFHGDWGRLSRGNQLRVLDVMARCPWHDFMPLTKCPDDLADFFTRWSDTEEADYTPRLARGPEATRAAHTCGRALLFADMLEEMGTPPPGCAYPTYDWMEGMCRWPSTFRNVSIGCSVMNQSEADKMRPAMKAISGLGWRTHVWHEPAIGPVNWRGWEFLELLVMGGESGPGARPCDIAWFRANLLWCQESSTKAFVKQLGARPVIAACRQNHYDWGGEIGRKARFSAEDAMHPSSGMWRVHLNDRKGADPAEWPKDLRVRQYPEIAVGGTLRP